MNSVSAKKNRVSVVLLICFIIPLHNFGQAPTKAWDLRKDKNGIKVYTKLEPGNDIRSYKVEFSVNHKTAIVEKELSDVDSFIEWSANLEECEVVGKEGDSFYTRSVYGAPWPIDDREAVMKVTIERPSEDVVTITSSCAPNQIPDEGKFIRVQRSYGQWTITRINNAKCDLVYSGYSDPAGAIPDWLVNAFSVDVPYNTAENLIEYLDDKY